MYHSLQPGVTPPIQPITDLVMPAVAQHWWEIGFAVAFLVGAGIMLREIARDRSGFPIFLWLGCILFVFAEPIIDVGQAFYYPVLGQNTAFELLGRKMPMFVLPMYWGLVPAMLLPLANRIQRGAGPTFYWGTFAAMGGSLVLFEILSIHVGVWTHIGAHAVRILDFPIVIAVVNTAAFMATSAAIAALRPRMTGRRTSMAVFIVPLVLTAMEFGVGWPAYSTANSASALENPLVAWAGTLGSLALSLAVVWWLPVLFGSTTETGLEGRGRDAAHPL